MSKSNQFDSLVRLSDLKPGTEIVCLKVKDSYYTNWADALKVSEQLFNGTFPSIYLGKLIVNNDATYFFVFRSMTQAAIEWPVVPKESVVSNINEIKSEATDGLEVSDESIKFK